MQDNTLRDKLREFYDSHEMPGGFYFDHLETLRRINLYSNREFRSGRFDEQGFRKYFKSVSRVPVDVARKFIDIDTKNISVLPERAGNEFDAFIAREDLERWMEDKDLDKLQNQIRDELPRTGHAVIKKHGKDNNWDIVHIENLRMDTAAPTLKEGGWVIEQHVKPVGAIEDMAEKWDWKNTEKLKRRFAGQDKFIFFECYHKKEGDWYRTIKSDIWRVEDESLEASINDETTYMPSITVREEEKVEFPYREIKFKDVRGRWLGEGFIEMLFDAQIAVNEAENLERKGLYFTSLHLFWSSDDEVSGQNVLENMTNGDILQADDFQPVVNEERNLPAYRNTQQSWQNHVTRNTFTQDVATGANLPSRTRIGVAEQQMQAVASYFEELKRERFGGFIANWIERDVMPQFSDDQSERHRMMFAGNSDMIQRLDEFIVDAKVTIEINRVAKETGFFPSQQRQEEIRQSVRDQLDRQEHRYLEIPENFYDDIEYKIDIDVVGESVDKQAQQATVQQGLQVLNNNPQVVENESTRKFFFKLMELGGISPTEMGLTGQRNSNQRNRQQQQQQGEPQQGGSMAAPRQFRQQLQRMANQQ